MNFVDEASIKVEAGKGGDGCLSFRREKFIEHGGPNGGDGGRGGSIFFVGDEALNTLVDFRFQPNYRAQKGEHGKGTDRTGAKGEDLFIKVPLGTSVFDEETDDFLGDINTAGEQMLVAQGGRNGLGNTRFKSSTNRAPRQTTPGEAGEVRILRLELKLIADVGLLGMPNAGKSTLIAAVSAARPKIADYPFTTLVPNLGVVRLAHDNSFVIADIPGLIEGAADGAGLGVQFLKHLSRTRVLLHLLDLCPADGSDPLENCRLIEEELARYSEGIAEKPRWIVLTKLDLLPKEKQQEQVELISQKLGIDHIFAISSVSGHGLDRLLGAIGQFLLEMKAVEKSEREDAEALIRQEIHEFSLQKRMERKRRRDAEDDDDENYDVKVHYEP